MNQYRAIAAHYDAFTPDVDRARWATFLENLLKKHGCKPKMVLDLACGTGEIACEFAKRGYDVLGVDASREMLSIAADKAKGLANPPFFIHQRMEKLKLLKKVDAVVSCLDSINYLASKKTLHTTFLRVGRSLKPDGLFIFDINTPHKFKILHGQTYIRENQNAFCAWQPEYNEKSRTAKFYVNIFTQTSGGLYERSLEFHRQRAHSHREIARALADARMKIVGIYGELTYKKPGGRDERVFYVVKNEPLKTHQFPAK